ncbi:MULTISPECIES: ABC transporter substrate-binding protein [unclassified Prochlorococcus]|uniref:ABC transporter substrate-binding protein n=1 Tax=unclassified Prochlorococcus TaxID=2627481 RepID=UPI000533985D|nr:MULTISPECIES: ABC transporter substrate-binding protein [unclassified Prochlorococcus]KGG16521.1 Periplasmic binding protein-like II [Prochlorococcus sp. MIT 0602]KGG17003.1 Periplasmic binding protein-like II [Prochlorococcus sp. MIT 0603]
MVSDITLGRRDFIRLSLLTAVLSLTGCSFSSGRPTVGLAKGLLPREFLQALPSPWRYELLDDFSENDFHKLTLRKNPDLIVLGDGWLRNFPYEKYQPIQADILYNKLSNQAISFLDSFKPTVSSRLFPVAVSPWVLIFRGGEELLSRAGESWETLLDPSLRGQVVLPSSSRVIMALAERMGDKDALRRLRSQAKSFDDKNGLNWLLSGRAKVAVLPLQFCLSSLASDPRLTIVFPKEGSPLNWTLLMQSNSSLQSFPLSWIQQTWKMPLLLKLLSRGIMPPVPYSDLSMAIESLPERYRLIYQSEEKLSNCWSLKPLTNDEEQLLETRWLNSAP